jgi:L-2-hydroxyglutarate oxidase
MKRLLIIGGGIVGLATALKAAQAGIAKNITLLEKDAELGQHQSSRNSGVLHCGLYYKPGSLKARLAVTGIREMTTFCQDHEVPHEICGKVVVAVDEKEMSRLGELLKRGQENGVSNIRRLSSEQIQEIEPHVVGKAGLHVPEEGIVDYPAVMRAMTSVLKESGHSVRTGVRVNGVRSLDGQQIVMTASGEFKADYVVNCAGLHCDRVATASGLRPECRIIPFRGDYWHLSPQGERLVRHLVYPVPDPTFPFLGVHFTRMIAGGVEAGPNAVLALKREGYRKTDFSLRDTGSSLSFPGLYRFLVKYPSMAWQELLNSFSKKAFLANLQRLIPSITMDDLSGHTQSGVRAQAIHTDGSLLMDFHIEKRPGQLHLLNAPSPGATASLAIGGYLVNQIARELGDPPPFTALLA